MIRVPCDCGATDCYRCHPEAFTTNENGRRVLIEDTQRDTHDEGCKDCAFSTVDIADEPCCQCDCEHSDHRTQDQLIDELLSARIEIKIWVIKNRSLTACGEATAKALAKSVAECAGLRKELSQTREQSAETVQALKARVQVLENALNEIAAQRR